MNITAATRLFVLLGDPIAHSFSPRMQNAAFRAADVDGVYVALRCGTNDVANLIGAVTAAGGGGNVTIPHKTTAALAVTRPEDVVRRTGACNTFWHDGNDVRGDNTDVAGFRSAVAGLMGSSRGLRVLLLGAGGAARAAACALLDDGATIDIVARSPGRAADLGARLDPAGERVRVLASIEDAAGDGYDLIVNATPLGLHDEDPSAIDLDGIVAPAGLIDLVCRHHDTRLVESARARGIAAIDGRAMLIAQGAAAFERWWNRPAPVDIMRAALHPER